MFKCVSCAYDRSAQANLNESQSYAMQGGCFVIAANSIINEAHIDAITQGNGDLKALVRPGGGAAAIYGPAGFRLTAPIDEHTAGLAIAAADLGMIEGAKVFADPAGHYNRPDVARIVLERSSGPALPADAPAPAIAEAAE